MAYTVDQEWRIRKENAGIVDDDPESIWWGLQQALKDRKLYMFIILQMALITAQSFNNFFPSIAMFVPSTGGRYFSMFLMTGGSYSPYNLCVSWVSASLPRPRSKRAASLAIVNFMGAGVAHFYTAYMFPDSQKPRYYVGGAVMSASCLICASLALYIKHYLKKQNRKFETEEEQGVVNHAGIRGSKAGHGGDAVVAFRYVH
ncbi:hypothetical protein Daus18300_014288 [Diaporthe australafricana]|uniref:Uncharacterized protein n=1 Tax=Diaporthe australafricana TaxID=127596 RepID=A0ABR3VVW1_9PEZI